MKGCLAGKSYLLVATIIELRPQQTIFYFSAILEKIEMLGSVLPKLWTCYFFLTRYDTYDMPYDESYGMNYWNPCRYVNPTAVVPIAALVLPMIDCFLIIFEALFACCHCEFIGWNSTLTLIINLFGLIVSSGIVQSAISYRI